jgi:NADPH:quinone reductase-like Zn-dependent oxidoreductase
MVFRDFGFGIPELPYLSGRELAGTVAQVDDNESRWKVGDRVCSLDDHDIAKPLLH